MNGTEGLDNSNQKCIASLSVILNVKLVVKAISGIIKYYYHAYTGWAEKNVPNFWSILQMNDSTENCKIWIPQSCDIFLLIFKFGWKSIHQVVTYYTSKITL